jgi:hypothetical protein
MNIYRVTSQQSPPAIINATSRAYAIKQYVFKNRGYLSATAYRAQGKIWAKKSKQQF